MKRQMSLFRLLFRAPGAINGNSIPDLALSSERLIELQSYAPLLTAIVKSSKEKFHSSITHTHTHDLCFFFFILPYLQPQANPKKMAIYESQNRVFYAFIIRVAWELRIGFGHSMQFARFFDWVRRLRMSQLAVKWAQKETRFKCERRRGGSRPLSVRKRLYRLLSVSVAEDDK